MAQLMHRIWQEEEGVLSFEWILLITLVVIGIVGGLAAARDAIIDEMGDVAQATIALDQSYTLSGATITSTDGVSIVVVLEDSEFTDTAPFFSDCIRGSLDCQGPEAD
jgi:hypothetical protein